MVLRFDAIAFILGLGYVMGLRASMILCAGGVLSNFVLVPLIWMIGQHFPDAAVYPGDGADRGDDGRPRSSAATCASSASARSRRPGIFGIIKSLQDRGRLLLDRGEGVPARRGRRPASAPTATSDHADPDRRRRVGASPSRSSSATSDADGRRRRSSASALTLVFSFFFTSVAANAIATTARNPVSGHDDADDHHLVGRAARVRRLGPHRDVLRHGDRRHGLHGALGLGPDDHGPEDRLLAGLDARRAGAGQVPRRHRGVGRVGPRRSSLLAQTFQFGEAAPGDTRAGARRRRRPRS